MARERGGQEATAFELKALTLSLSLFPRELRVSSFTSSGFGSRALDFNYQVFLFLFFLVLLFMDDVDHFLNFSKRGAVINED